MEGISVEQAVEQILQHTPVINETEETELNKAGEESWSRIWWQGLTILLLTALR